MAFRVIHDSKCPEYAPDKTVCACAHDAVISLTHGASLLTDRMIEVMHALENSKPNGEIPILAPMIRERLRAQILGDVNTITKRMLGNWRSQTT